MPFLRSPLPQAPGPAAPAEAGKGTVTVSPGRVETRFGDETRVVFKVEIPGSGAHPSVRWSIRKLDGSLTCTVGHIADPAGEKGIFLAFPVEKTIICRVRATVNGTSRFGEATLVIHPPVDTGGKYVGACDADGPLPAGAY
jgi:hypothetical protein